MRKRYLVPPKGGGGRSPISGLAIGIAVCLALAVVPAQAVTLTIADGNSTLSVDTGSGSPGTKAGGFDVPGMYSWTVNGVENMYQQWFWYRIGSTGPEQSIDTLNLLVAETSKSFSLRSDPDQMCLIYGSADATFNKYGVLQTGWAIQIKYTLSGGLEGEESKSDVGETITILNKTGSGLDFHFFQYTDFDLGGTADDDLSMILGVDSPVLAAQQIDGSPHLTASETVIAPKPSYYEAGNYYSTLTSLEDLDPTTLSNTVMSALGDATWAFQWDQTIGNGTSFQISKDKQITMMPEPATMAGFILGVGGLVRYAKKRRMA